MSTIESAEEAVKMLAALREECLTLSMALFPPIPRMTVDAVIQSVASDRSIESAVHALGPLRDALKRCELGNSKPFIEALDHLEKEVTDAGHS
jgi:hypothetical protein